MILAVRRQDSGFRIQDSGVRRLFFIYSPHTPHPTPYTPHPTPYTLHPTPHSPLPHTPIHNSLYANNCLTEGCFTKRKYPNISKDWLRF
ncbi:MAG: hypothetical protein EWV40_00150 [Microcystis flos-aquae Mf_WU_F_19750830_S460]|uniref:Uncharacterized protein n=1 Tax=Microcystis flos-aquae Mf_WU_F_19750830_S460 TaxID=2486237 RepID=A0A552M5Y2_9CHRO|nr:MAG: hypothetical protein EWV40_00150 [Microcystis flos-aquae Mf_WU_F_19750830_S460]